MDRPQMDQQVERILQQARQRIVEQASGSLQSMAQMEDLIYGELNRCKQAGMRWRSVGLEPLLRVRCALKDGRYWRHFGRWPDDLAAWQARRKQRRRAA